MSSVTDTDTFLPLAALKGSLGQQALLANAGFNVVLHWKSTQRNRGWRGGVWKGGGGGGVRGMLTGGS